MAHGRRNNGGALSTVASKAQSYGLIEIAIQAISAIDKEYQFIVSADHFLWRHRWAALSPETATRWEKRILANRDDEDWRSSALTGLGMLRMSRGDMELGLDLWNAGRDRESVDRAISELAVQLVEEESDARLSDSLWLAELIEGPVMRAETLAELTDYLG